MGQLNQTTLGEADCVVASYHKVVQHSNVNQGQRRLEGLRQVLVCAAWVGGAAK
jgi:hypothetical protein